MKYCNALLFLLLFIPFAAHGLPVALGEGKEIAADSDMSESAEERGFPSKFMHAHIRGYDTEGRLGVGAIYPIHPGGSVKAKLDQGITYYYGIRDFIGTEWLVDAPLGSSYRFHSHVPFYGWVSGRGRVETGEHTAWYVIPVKGSQDGMVELEERDYSRFGASVSCRPILLDRVTSPTLAVPLDTLNPPSWYRSQGATMSVEYLDDDIEDVCRYLPPGSFAASGPQFRWGPGELTGGASILELGEPAPTGSVKLSVALDGYTTSTITTQIKPNRLLIWNGGFVSLGDAPTASDYINDPFYSFKEGEELRDAPGATGMLLEVSR